MFEILNKRIKQSCLSQYDAVFHVGAPKTGSSALQKTMLMNRRVLEKYGFYYPEHGLDENGVSGGQSDIAMALRDKNFDKAQRFLKRYIEEAKARKLSLLLSSEGLYVRSKELKALVSGLHVKIIIFFRHPLDAVYSYYNQGVKRHFSTARIDVFCENIIAGKGVSLLSEEILEEWGSVFSSDDLTVLPYSSMVLEQEGLNIQQFFLKELGVCANEYKKKFISDEMYVNYSYSLAALELKRLTNLVVTDEKQELSHKIDLYLQGFSDKKGGSDYSLQDSLNDDLYESLSEKLMAAADKISERYFPEYKDIFNVQAEKGRKVVDWLQVNRETADMMIEMRCVLPDVVEKLRALVENRLEKEMSSMPSFSTDKREYRYELWKLADCLGVNVYTSSYLPKAKVVSSKVWFSRGQLENMPRFELVDFYRSIAELLYQRKDYIHAQRLVSKAMKLRPRGGRLVKLSQKIEGKIKEE